jgi:PAS domain S-box-containing protein
MYQMNPLYPYMDVVILAYALAFLALGLTVLLLNERDSALDVSRLFWLLAAFAFVHGAFECIGLRRHVYGPSPILETCGPFMLLASYLFLFEFGRRLVLIGLTETWKTKSAARLLTAWTYLPLLAVILVATAGANRPLWGLTYWSRHLVGFPGACLTGLGFYLYWRNRIVDDEELAGHSRPGLAWYAAAFAFAAYGVVGGLVDSGSRSAVSTSNGPAEFVTLFGVPIEILRASCAAIAAISVGSLLTIFRIERQRKVLNVSITNRVAMQELYRIKARCDAILIAASEGILGIDVSGNVVFVNDNALHMLGYRRQDLVGKSVCVVVEQPAAAAAGEDLSRCAIYRTIQDGIVRRESGMQFWRKNRTWFPAEYNVAPMRAGERTEGAVIAFRDMAENTLIERRSANPGQSGM